MRYFLAGIIFSATFNFTSCYSPTNLDYLYPDSTITIKYQDDMRMESDDENFQNTKIPSHFISNINFSSKFYKFLITLSVNNIFDEKYFNYAVASSSTIGTYNAYPQPGREIFLNIGVKF